MLSRRELLRKSGRSVVLAGSLQAVSAALAQSRPVVGANEKVSLALIGCGNRRRQLIPAFLEHPDARIRVACDVLRNRAEAAAELVEKTSGTRPEVLEEYQRVLERRDIDAVVIATPEHWKCLAACHACLAGKDIYVEKPLALTIGEGRRIIEVAERSGRLAMFGTQQRSMTSYQEAVAFIQSGKLGKISEVRSWNFENRAPEGYGNPPDQKPPGDLNWDVWLGPAPQRPYNPNRYHAFHFFWDYGGGWQCDWAVHMHDVVHWAMKVDGPLSAIASGGKFARRDNTEHPDTFEAVYEYPGFISVYSYRHGNGLPFEGMWYGNAFFGENGTLVINRDVWRVIPEPVDAYDPAKRKVMRMSAVEKKGSVVEGPHQRAFVDAVKSRRQPEGTDLLTGHRSTIAGHLANISYRTGRKVVWDVKTETARDISEADRLTPPLYRLPWILPG
jgi:predicted dehydrogenase